MITLDIVLIGITTTSLIGFIDAKLEIWKLKKELSEIRKALFETDAILRNAKPGQPDLMYWQGRLPK